MTSFANTPNATPYGFFDADVAFQSEADAAITFVKRSLGEDILSVELTRKQIWMCLEQATLEFSSLINQYQIKSELANILGMSTGSLSGSTGIYHRQTLEFLMRQAEPYATYAGVGGSHDSILGYIDLVSGQQDYNLYSDLKHPVSGTSIVQTLPSGSLSKFRIIEVLHFSPLAAQNFLLNASNVTNFLASEFSFESYVNSTVFYVLPVFEDVLRRGMLEVAHKVRRSNYSYQIIGRNLRLYPIPNTNPYNITKLWIRVATAPDPADPSYQDDTIYGVSNLSNAPYGNIEFSKMNSVGRQWIRSYMLALAKELLGLIRSKMKTIPIPNGDLQLNGEDLIQQARDDKDKLRNEIKELLESLTYYKLIEQEATKAQNLNTQLKYIPVGRAIIVG